MNSQARKLVAEFVGTFLLVFLAVGAAIFGIAAHDAASGDPLETVTAGVFDLSKIGSQAWAPGDKVYWDNTNKRVTKIATDNTLMGVALGIVGSSADETTGRVRLNGSF